MAFGFPAKYQEIIEWDHEEEFLFQIVEEGLEILQWQVTNHRGDMIYAKTPTGSVTLGERILIQIVAPKVAIRSECYIPTQLWDFGKNQKNVDRLIEVIEAVRLDKMGA